MAASRILNRKELRKQSDAAEQAAPAEPDTPAAVVPPKKRTRAKAAAPKRKKSRKKAPPRLRARWGVFDAGMKQVAIFDYNQRVAADEKVAQMSAKKNGLYFLQIVKEPMPELPVEVPLVGTGEEGDKVTT
jgi:hypothetical protein